MLFPHSDHEAQPWGGPKADENGGAGAEPPLTLGLPRSWTGPSLHAGAALVNKPLLINHCYNAGDEPKGECLNKPL